MKYEILKFDFIDGFPENNLINKKDYSKTKKNNRLFINIVKVIKDDSKFFGLSQLKLPIEG
jgi:hypothetical protein